MRLMDSLVVFPSLLIAVALAAALGGSVTTIIIATRSERTRWQESSEARGSQSGR